MYSRSKRRARHANHDKSRMEERPARHHRYLSERSYVNIRLAHEDAGTSYSPLQSSSATKAAKSSSVARSSADSLNRSPSARLESATDTEDRDPSDIAKRRSNSDSRSSLVRLRDRYSSLDNTDAATSECSYEVDIARDALREHLASAHHRTHSLVKSRRRRKSAQASLHNRSARYRHTRVHKSQRLDLSNCTSESAATNSKR